MNRPRSPRHRRNVDARKRSINVLIARNCFIGRSASVFTSTRTPVINVRQQPLCVAGLFPLFLFSIVDRSNPAYTCPFPNCSRQFNVNSNMRRHYRTHFTPGAFDLTELSYSTADERFYPMAVNNTSPANSTNTAGHHTRGRCNTGPFIPPMPSASYGSSFSPTSQSYPPLRIPPNSEARSNRPAPYVVPITVYHNQRPQSHSIRDRLPSPPLRSPNHRSHPPSESMLVGRLKPASDWNLSRDRRRDDDTDEYSDDQDESNALDDDDLASPH